MPHVAVFDTAFHATLPPRAYTYAVPREWGVRRYGFHGTSHAYVSREAGRVLGRDDADVIVLHLGNGASASAVSGGRSIDTSMGLTPLEGLVMGTRSGDVDPALILHLRRTRNLSTDEIDKGLNSRSGLLALAGDNDMREVQRRVAAGDAAAELALDVYCYRIRKYVGAYLAALGGADAIVFTAGVGENDPIVRARSLAGLERLGIVVDATRNAAGRDGHLRRRLRGRGAGDPDQRGARDGDPGGRARVTRRRRGRPVDMTFAAFKHHTAREGYRGRIRRAEPLRGPVDRRRGGAAVRAPLRDRGRRRVAHAARGGDRTSRAAVVLESDGEGHWRVNERSRPDLDGCVDVDLEGSAFTNAFPVARGATDAPAAWVRLDLSVERLEQTYARAGERTYDYESPGFRSRLVFGADGIVVEYPGIATRTH